MSRAEAIAESLAGAVRFLEKVLAAPESDIQKAAAIKPFEFCFKLSWKLLQERLREEGVDVATPRAAFRAAGDAQLIAEVEPWLTYLGARNLTSHTYNEKTAEQVYAVIRGGFPDAVRELLEPRGDGA
jgi:nucleotidyltransferase substrate binding protein (TIGR01987 family)